MKKMTHIKDVLLSVRELDLAAENAILDYKSLESDIMRITPTYSGTKVRNGSKSSDLSGAVARLVKAKEKARRRAERYAAAKTEIIELIALMDDEDEAKCLRLKYLAYRERSDNRPLSWDAVADRMYMSRRKAITLHGRALIHFEKLWNETRINNFMQ